MVLSSDDLRMRLTMSDKRITPPLASESSGFPFIDDEKYLGLLPKDYSVLTLDTAKAIWSTTFNLPLPTIDAFLHAYHRHLAWVPHARPSRRLAIEIRRFHHAESTARLARAQALIRTLEHQRRARNKHVRDVVAGVVRRSRIACAALREAAERSRAKLVRCRAEEAFWKGWRGVDLLGLQFAVEVWMGKRGVEVLTGVSVVMMPVEEDTLRTVQEVPVVLDGMCQGMVF